MSYLVANPEDRFSHDEAYMSSAQIKDLRVCTAREGDW